MTQSAHPPAILSDAWYEAYGRVLAEAVRSRSARLRDVDFTLCEVITGCPGRGDAAHWFTVRGGGVEFGRGLKEGADTRVTVPYETALAISKIPMDELEAGRTAPRPEPDGFRLEGVSIQTMAPALREVLRETHDQLAKLIARD
jgi:hypothetical protein